MLLYHLQYLWFYCSRYLRIPAPPSSFVTRRFFRLSWSCFDCHWGHPNINVPLAVMLRLVAQFVEFQSRNLHDGLGLSLATPTFINCTVTPIMRLSILCPTTPPTGLGGARWGFVILASTKAPPLGATFADKSPLIPCIGGGAAVGKWGMEENSIKQSHLLI